MPLQSINEAVKDRISKSNPDVLEAVLAGLTKKETDRRTLALITGIEKATQVQKDLYKAKPDQQVFDANGALQSEGYTKPASDAKKKLEEKLAKLNKAIEKAEGGDFGDLYGAIDDKAEKKD